MVDTSTEQGRGASRVPYPSPLWSRIGSLLLAAALSGFILLDPDALALTVSDRRTVALTLMLWGTAAGFVHGVGFVPRRGIWRVLFHPVAGWPLMAGGILWMCGQ